LLQGGRALDSPADRQMDGRRKAFGVVPLRVYRIKI